jgi:serine/threonine protein kinase
MKFDARDKKWSRESGKIDSVKIREDIDINSHCNVNIEKRIGSVSTMAEVYLVQVKNIEMACKVLPIDSDESIDRNANELILVNEASKCRSIYFPKVYGAVFCLDTFFYNGKCEFNCNIKIPEFYNKSKRYQQYAYLSDISSDNLKSKIIKYKKSFIDAEIARKKILPEIELPDTVASYLLFSELAEYDLDYYLEHNKLSNKELYVLLFDIFKAIKDMHQKLKIVHADLHLGNILIKNNKPLIHDFGKSYKSDFTDLNDKEKDIFYFLGQLYEKISVPQKIKSLLEEVSDIVLNSVAKYPIMDVVKFWALNINDID